jgi:hypothetical protein
MRRRSKAGGEPTKAHHRKTAARKSRAARKAVRRRSFVANHETELERVIRERDEALEQRRAISDVL